MPTLKKATKKTARRRNGEEVNALSTVRKVAAVASLRSISVLQLRAEMREPPERVGGNHEFSTSTRTVAKRLQDGLAEVLVTLDVRIRRKGDSEHWAEVSVTVRLVYGFSNAAPSKEDLDEFARLNGTYNAWPYLRENVQAMTIRMGVAPLILPLYRVKAPMPARLPPAAPSGTG